MPHLLIQILSLIPPTFPSRLSLMMRDFVDGHDIEGRRRWQTPKSLMIFNRQRQNQRRTPQEEARFDLQNRRS